MEKVVLTRAGVKNATNNARLVMARIREYNSLGVNDINPNILRLHYAVRGPIVQRATALEKELKQRINPSFSSIIKCNIGDCHFSKQKPITFIRKVLSCATDQSLFDSPSIPEDAKYRAKRFLDNCGGSVGVYSQSTGVEVVREDIAKYIEARDGISSNPENIFLSTGASEAAKSVLQLLGTGKDGTKRAGIMVPIPQYPLYSATIAEYNAHQIGYYLDESNNWSLSLDNLEEALTKNEGQCAPRALVVINPGNPTSQTLSEATIQKVLQFAHKHNLVVIADEVYQHNIYSEQDFISFKRVLHGMGSPIANELQLASLMSCSKGYMGECGLRGGYCELVNFDPAVREQLYKCLSARLCPPLLGQLTMDVVVNPPRPHETSYKQFSEEKKRVLEDLTFKADLVYNSLNALPGYHCNKITGAMYAFPRVELPTKAIETAKIKNVEPDFLYCLELLENTGVCMVPGSGFGQLPGTSHFRTTILPTVQEMKVVVEKIKGFHADFLTRYG